MSDSPERDRLYREMDKLFFAYAPLKPLAHRIITGLAHPWVVGYRRNPVTRELWKYLDIDESVLPAQLVRAGRAAAALRNDQVVKLALVSSAALAKGALSAPASATKQ